MENSSSGGGANNQPYRVDLAEDLEEAQELGSGAGSNHGNQGESQENGYDDDYGYQGHDGSYHGDSASSLFSGAENPLDLQSTYSRSGQGGFIPAIALSLLTGGRSGGINFGIIFSGGSSHRGSQGERDYYSPYEEESGFHDNVLAIEQTPKKNKNAVRKKKPLEKNKESPEYLANPTECSSVTQSGDGPFMNPGMEQTATTTLENPQTHASVSEQLPVSARGQSGRKTVTDAVDSIEDKVSCTLLSTTATTTMLLTTAAATTATVTTAAATTTIATTAAATTLPLTTVAAAKTAMATTTAMTTTSATTTMLTTTNATTLTKTALTTLKTSATEAETATGLATPIPTKTTPIATLTTKISTKTTSIATANTKTKATTTTPIATAVATRTTAATTTPKATAAATTKITTIATAAATTKSTPIATAATTTKITPIATIVSAETKKGSSIITSYQESNVNCTDQIKDQLDNQPLPSILSLEDTSGGQLPGNHGTAADLASWEMDDVCMDDAFPDLNFPSRSSLMKTSSAPQLSKRNKNANVSVKKNVFKSALEHDWTTTESTVLGKTKTLSGADSQMDGADKRRLSPADGSRMREEKTPSAEKPKRERQQIKNFGRGYRDDPQMQHLEDGQTEQELASYHDSTSSQLGQLMGSSADEGTLKGMLKDEDDQHGLRPFDVEGRLSQCHSGSAGQGHSVSAGQGQTPQQMFGDVETQGMGDRQEWKTRPHTAMVKQLDERTGSRFYEMVSNMKELVASKGLIVKDVYPDGNCLFAAVVDQLRVRAEFYYTARTLRAAAVESLREHPTQDDGTHLQEFLTEGTWEGYLSRMGTDGMWGDHMILRSICEVLKRTIVILGGISGLSRTVLEPSSATQLDTESNQEPGTNTADDDCLYLGHMAESHYVSLRHKDWEDRLHQILRAKTTSCFLKAETVSEDDRSTTETTETESGSTEGSLSDNTGQSTTGCPLEEERDKQKLNTILKWMFEKNYIYDPNFNDNDSFSDHKTSKATGIIVGSNVEHMTASFVYVLPFYGMSSQNPLVERDKHAPPLQRTQPYGTIFLKPFDTRLIQRDETSETGKDVTPLFTDYVQGYMKLLPVTPQKWRPCVKEDASHNECLIHMFGATVEEADSNRCRIAFRSDWPDQAMDFVTRERQQPWPGPDLIVKIVDDSCIVVPWIRMKKTDQDEEEADLIWKFSFSVAEKLIATKAVTKQQRKVFQTFRLFVENQLKGTNALIRTVCLISTFFYTCEKIPEATWSKDPITCVLLMVVSLLEQLRNGHADGYFIRERNLLEGIRPERLGVHIERLEFLRHHILVSVYFILDRHRITNTTVGILLDTVLERGADTETDGYISMDVYGLPTGISRTVLGCLIRLQFSTALQTCLTSSEESSRSSKAGTGSSFSSLILNIIPYALEGYRWAFAFYCDRQTGSLILNTLLDVTETLSLSYFIGPAMEQVFDLGHEELKVPRSMGESPHRILGLVDVLTDVLVFVFDLKEILIEVLHYFLLHHGRTILLVDVPSDDDDGIFMGRPNQRIETYYRKHKHMLCLFFEKLWMTSAVLGDFARLSQLIELYEEVCDQVKDPIEYMTLASVCSSTGNQEGYRRALIKARSTQAC